MLKPLYANQLPTMWDALDSETSFKGGEVVGLTYLSITNSDVSAKDEADGYVSTTSKTRPVATKALVSGMRPYMLVDDGGAAASSTNGYSAYGTIYGSVVGGTAGQSSTSTFVGPATFVGSGKLTCYAGPGLFAVTVDAVDTTASTGLVPTNTTLAGNADLYATSTGLLTPNAGAAVEAVVLGHFVEFTTNGSRVTTTGDLVGNVLPLTQAVFFWNPEY